MKIRAILILVSLSMALGASSQLVINEIMQSNIDLIMDDLNEFPDSWVELYNPTTSAEDLSQYSILDKDKPSKAYALPETTVAPCGYVLIYCDKEATGLHASFRLESGKGCNLYLFRNGERVDAIENLKKQPAPNISYGRVTSGSDQWGYLTGATPGFPNCGKTAEKVLPDPVFSVAGRICQEPLDLAITLPEEAPEGAVIRYTLDGSEPGSASPVFDPASTLAVTGTTIVRAKLFCEGWLTGRSVGQSYIFHPREVTLPVVSITGNSKYFYDKSIGILVEGKNPQNPNFCQDWRRPVNLEIFYPENPEESVINQLIETRVKGGASRWAGLKSLVLYANKRFGVKRLEHEFFPAHAPGLTDWKSVELRNAGNDFDYMYFRDAAIQRVMGTHADLDWQPWQPAILYINGEYKGMLNIRPRSNEDYVYTFYDGLEDIDMFENWWELKEGEASSMEDFMAFFAGHPSYQEFEERMDVEEYCNLMIMNLYHVNLDFPGNNIVQWRPQAEGGKWRWIAKDTDFGLGLYDRDYKYKMLDWIYNNRFDPDNSWANGEDATRLFRRMMELPEFKDMFIDRAGVYMGDFLNSRGHNEAIDEMYDQIKFEYKFHRELFNRWWPNHAEEVQKAKTWVRNRTDYFYNYLAEYFGMGEAVPLVIDPNRQDGLVLRVNGVPLNYRTFDGKWWQGRRLKISGMTSDGTGATVGWTVKAMINGNEVITECTGHELELVVPSCTRLTIISKIGESSLDETLREVDGVFNPEAGFEAVDLAGRRLGKFASLADARRGLAPGVYLLTQNGRTYKQMI